MKYKIDTVLERTYNGTIVISCYRVQVKRWFCWAVVALFDDPRKAIAFVNRLKKMEAPTTKHPRLSSV